MHKLKYPDKLFFLLKLFDQKSKVKNNEHRLWLIRRFFPGFLDRVIKRLQAADINNPDIEEQMFTEDEYLKALIDRNNQITYFKDEIDKKDKIILEFTKTLKESGFLLMQSFKKTAIQPTKL